MNPGISLRAQAGLLGLMYTGRMKQLGFVFVTLVVLVACSTPVVVSHSESDAGADADVDSDDAGNGDADSQDAQGDAPIGPVLFECGADAGLPATDAGCSEIAPGTFGFCEVHVGYVYYDYECQHTDGCSGPNPPGTFVTTAECQKACGAAGKCNTSKLDKFDLGKPLEGQFCDDVEIIGSFSANSPPAWLCAIAPSLRCEGVADGSMRCRVYTHTLSSAEVAELCALSLATEVDRLRCWVYL